MAYIEVMDKLKSKNVLKIQVPLYFATEIYRKGSYGSLTYGDAVNFFIEIDVKTKQILSWFGTNNVQRSYDTSYNSSGNFTAEAHIMAYTDSAIISIDKRINSTIDIVFNACCKSFRCKNINPKIDPINVSTSNVNGKTITMTVDLNSLSYSFNHSSTYLNYMIAETSSFYISSPNQELHIDYTGSFTTPSITII